MERGAVAPGGALGFAAGVVLCGFARICSRCCVLPSSSLSWPHRKKERTRAADDDNDLVPILRRGTGARACHPGAILRRLPVRHRVHGLPPLLHQQPRQPFSSARSTARRHGEEPKPAAQFDIVALCVQPEPEFRPPMSEVVQSLVRLMQCASLSKRRSDSEAGLDYIEPSENSI